MSLLLFLLAACAGPDTTIAKQMIDNDGDGYTTEVDCDDGHATVNPDAPEVCDGLDNDCDGSVDDSVPDAPTWYADTDGDGYGDAGVPVEACDAPPDHVADRSDCDDTRGDVHPDAEESDCTDPTDYNCDGSVVWADADGDGFAACVDCADTDAARNPGADERCAEGDEDCDGLDGDADPSVSDPTPWYRDADGDGFAPGTDPRVEQCVAPPGYAAALGDCDDADPRVSPDGAEVCDPDDRDEDCDGLVDDADPSTDTATWTTWYADRDGDTHGDATRSTQQCEAPPGYVDGADDCDDAEVTAHPGGVEVCDDDIDQDCSGADEVCPPAGYSGEYAVDAGYSTKIYGLAADDSFGVGLVGGDFDGDGVGDLVATALYGDASGYPDHGTVFGWYGGFTPGVERADDSMSFFHYNSSSSYSGSYGARVADVGDVDGDGRDDLYVYYSPTDGGIAYGGDTGELDHSSADDLSGACANAARGGTLDGSGSADDWICGSASDSSSAGVVHLYASGTWASPLASLSGEAVSDLAGNAVAGGGDVDGDGYDDVFVGAQGNDAGGSQGGAVYLVYTPVSGAFDLASADAKIVGVTNENLGSSLVAPGDLDGDGYADLVAAAYHSSVGEAGAGATYVFTEAPAGVVDASAVATAVFHGEDAYDYSGDALAAGDLDGDAVPDLAIASGSNDDGGTNAGAVWLTYGPFSGTYRLGTDSDAVWRGAAAEDRLGGGLAFLPDADGDGDDELAMGARRGDEGAYTDHGAVWIWLGQ